VDSVSTHPKKLKKKTKYKKLILNTPHACGQIEEDINILEILLKGRNIGTPLQI
jgi:hypothetical protein